MKILRNVTLGAAALLALSATDSFAQQGVFTLPYGFYVGIDGGVIIPQGIKTTLKGAVGATTLSGNGRLTLGNGPALGAFLGYNLTPWLAVEGDFDYAHMYFRGYRGLTATTAGVSTSGNAGATGSISTFTGLVNGIVHPLPFMGQPGTIYGVSPYIGVGVGASRWNDSLGTLSLAGTNYGVNSSREETDLAADGLVGIDFAATPQLSIGARYTFLYTDTHRIGSGGSISTSNDHFFGHMIQATFTYHFGVPTPPPPTPVAAPPAPPPAPPAATRQTFIVFFEFDKASLTPDGRKVVEEAAAAFRRGETVAVAGYTDLSGTAQYNLALSKRRAQTVQAALVRDGVPANAIDTSWHGMNDPRVPTAPGVREPQNRRVEINM